MSSNDIKRTTAPTTSQPSKTEEKKEEKKDSKETLDSKGRRGLYPPVDTYDTGFMKVDDIHTIYYEQSGNPRGKPIVIVHGGPGGGSVDYYRQFADASHYRIIQFDQRGAGKSTPHAELRNNTTWLLVDDMEKLRVRLGIEKWVVFGGSWGSTLALAYAEMFPQRVLALVLRGIFTLRRKELLFFYQSGADFLFPDAFDALLEPIPEVERHDMISAYHRRLIGTDEKEKLRCAKAWSVWEMTTSKLYVDPEYIKRAAEDDQFAVAFARIETHYFVNGGFFQTEGQLIDNAKVLKNIPGTIVQGRYDVVCPMRSAWDLHKQWPQAELNIIPDAGHSCKEDGIIEALVRATDKYREL